MAQWPNLRTLTDPRMVNYGNNGNDMEKKNIFIYDNPKYVQGEKSPWKYIYIYIYISEVFKTFLSS